MASRIMFHEYGRGKLMFATTRYVFTYISSILIL